MRNIRNRIKCLGVVFVCLCTVGIMGMTMSKPTPEALLVYDEDLNQAKIRNPRCFSTEFVKPRDNAELPTRAGLEKLRYSASAQFSESSLKQVLPTEGVGQIWLVDLRRESHGFVNGLPISWFAPQNQSNLDLSLSDVESQENKLLDALRNQPDHKIVINEITDKKSGIILKSTPHEVQVNLVESEQDFAHRLGLGYIRFPVSDHHRPLDAEVDAYVKFIRDLPEQDWLHFHCRAGKGRTTSFIVMLDILKNAKEVSFEDIVTRHYLMGGAELMNVSEDNEDNWKKQWAVDRKEFLQKFYEYAKSIDSEKILWSAWIQKSK